MLQSIADDFFWNVLMPLSILVGLITFVLGLAGQMVMKNAAMKGHAKSAGKAVGKEVLGFMIRRATRR